MVRVTVVRSVCQNRLGTRVDVQTDSTLPMMASLVQQRNSPVCTGKYKHVSLCVWRYLLQWTHI